jgi:hypothetical protein
MERFDINELALMAVRARRIWLRRNSFVFEGNFAHPNAVYNEAVTSFEEFKRCNLKETGSSPQALGEHRISTLSWSPPPAGVIKVNWDAYLNVTKGWIGLGITPRDSSCFCLRVGSVTKQVQVPPKMAEVMAALQAVQFSKEVGFMDVIFKAM